MPTVTDDGTGTLAAYTQLIGTWAKNAGKFECGDDNGATGYYLRHDTAAGSNDMYAQAVIEGTQANASSNGGVLVRGQTGATNTSYQWTGRHAGDTIAFWRIVAGVEAQLRLGCNAQGLTGAANTLSRAWAPGDTLRLEAIGSLLRGKHNGQLVAVTKDTTTATGQRGGLNGYNGVGTDLVQHDDLAIGVIDDLVSPYLVGVSAQVAGATSGAVITPTLDNVAAGRLVLVHVTTRDAAQTVTAPAGEGWTLIQNPSQTGLEGFIFGKIWGLGGQTDDSTPTFSIGTGTSGWAATAETWANPEHATNPWTSVASGVVASGSQSNASSTTVTAPSVTHTGSHRSISRFYGSADDNGLGLSSTATTNSEGALNYGGVGYHTTQGNDMAQAGTVLEDTTLAGSTGTATVTETLVGPDVSYGATLVIAIPTPPSTVNLTPASLAVSAVALSPSPLPVVVNLTPASVALSGVALSPVPGQVVQPLTPATLALSGVALSPSPLPVVVPLTPAAITLAAVALNPAPLPVVVPLTPAQLAVSGVALAPVPGQVSVSLTPAQLFVSGVALAPVPGLVTVPLTPAQATLTAVALNPAAGGSTVELTPAQATLSAVELVPVPGQVVVPLTPAALAVGAVALSPQPGQVVQPLTPAALAVVGVALSPQPGLVVVELVPATVLVEAVALSVGEVGPGIQVEVGQLYLVNALGEVVQRARTDELQQLTALGELVMRQAIGEMDIRYDVGELEAEP